jgi:hypothetical protein
MWILTFTDIVGAVVEASVGRVSPVQDIVFPHHTYVRMLPKALQRHT